MGCSFTKNELGKKKTKAVPPLYAALEQTSPTRPNFGAAVILRKPWKPAKFQKPLNLQVFKKC